MKTISKEQVDLYQGEDHLDRVFGYVAGEGGGFFFTWMPTLRETLDSLEVDEVDGPGNLSQSEVRDFLEEYLPTTPGGRTREWTYPPKAKPPAGPACDDCGTTEGVTLGPCPYAEEIHGDSVSLYHLCPFCREERAREI